MTYKVLYIQWETLESENFCEFQVVCKSFLGGVASFDSTGKQSMKVFSAKIVFFQQFAEVFSLESFPVYSSCMLAPTLLSRSQLVAIVAAGMLLRIHSSHSTVDFNSLRT